jgi:hypothetical protein
VPLADLAGRLERLVRPDEAGLAEARALLCRWLDEIQDGLNEDLSRILLGEPMAAGNADVAREPGRVR